MRKSLALFAALRIHNYLLPEGDGGMKLLLGLAELLIYFLLLQLGTAYAARHSDGAESMPGERGLQGGAS